MCILTFEFCIDSDPQDPGRRRSRAVCHRRRRAARPIAHRRAAPARPRRRSRRAPVSLAAEGRTARAGRGVAAARSVVEQRPAGRSADRDALSHLLRPTSTQGRLGDPSASRRLRTGWHTVQRLRTHRSRRRTPTEALRARCADARRVPARVRQFQQHRAPAADVQRRPRRRAVSSAAAGRSPACRDRTATTCSWWAGSKA